MEKIILFSEVVSASAYETAKQFVGQGHIVYALSEPGQESKKEDGIRYLPVNKKNREEIRAVLEEIPEQYLDLVVLSAYRHARRDGSITDAHDYAEMLQVFDENVNGALQTVQEALPLQRRGETKRIAVLTQERASINWNQEEADYAYLMSLAALNMMEKILFNTLRPEGFTFRNYAVSAQPGGMSAAEYLLQDLSYIETDDYIHSDENRVVMRDAFLRELPW